MAKENKQDNLKNLPVCAVDFINQVIRKMHYRRKVRRDVQAELIAHFEDALRDCDTVEKREQQARNLIVEFGDVKLLAVLLRRAKKRCPPLWKKIFLRIAQVVGIIFIYLLICASPLMIGKPSIKIDYVKWLNDSEQAGRDTSKNEKTYYEKAIKSLVRMPEWLEQSTVTWPTDFNDVEIKALNSWLESNKKSLEALRKAAECQGYWNHYERSSDETEDLQQAILPGIMELLPNYRKLAFAMRQNIRYEAYSGDVDQAINDCFVLIKMGYDIQGNGFLVEQLVGIAIEALGLGESFRILEKIDVPLGVLKSTQDQLENLYAQDKPVISFDSEKIFWYDILQRWFTDDGNGDGRPLGRGVAYSIDSDWTVLKILLFDYPSRQEVLSKVEEYFDRSEELLSTSPWDLHSEGIDANSWIDDVEGVSVMLDLNGPAFYRISQISWRMKTQRRGLLAVIALSLYEKENGKLPISLNELVEQGYLKSLPIDPFSGKPFVYKKTGDDFIIYSIGEDFKNDGGEVYRDDRGRVRMWTNKGDWVLWPVQE